MAVQKNKKFTQGNIIALIITVAAFAAILLAGCKDKWCTVFEWQKIRAVNNFATCQQLGFPVTSAYPRQCTAGDKTFSEADTDFKVQIVTPSVNEVIRSPLTVQGSALGTWFFEASFPVHLRDANGKEIVSVPAQAQDDWMTANPVPFLATLTFKAPATATGFLILEKDNPSGLPENADSVSIPVRFR